MMRARSHRRGRATRARALLPVVVLLVAGLPACKIQQTGRADSLAEAASGEDERRLESEVRFAVAVARDLRSRPDSAAAILEANRLTRAGLDSMLYRIAADPELAARYTRGLGTVATDELE